MKLMFIAAGFFVPLSVISFFQVLPAPVGTDWTGLATFVTAVAGAVVLIVNALRTKRIEEKVDKGAVVQDMIHVAVNSNMAAAVKKIDEGTAELRLAKEEISRLKAEAVREIKDELARFRQDSLPRAR